MRVLVIDDMEEFRALVISALGDDGHEVVVAANGAEGIKAFKESTFDLVITDILMPEADGLEVIKAIREINPDVPLIAMSGGGRAFPAVISLTASRAFGASEVLYKPFRVNELREAVGRVLRR